MNCIIFYFSIWYSSGFSHFFNIYKSVFKKLKNLSFSYSDFLITCFTSFIWPSDTFLFSLVSVKSLHFLHSTVRSFWSNMSFAYCSLENNSIFWLNLVASPHVYCFFFQLVDLIQRATDFSIANHRLSFGTIRFFWLIFVNRRLLFILSLQILVIGNTFNLLLC